MKSFKHNKILWLDLNSSYSHSSLALPAIHAQFSEDGGWVWSVVKATVNEPPGDIVSRISEESPDVIAATCWLFTSDQLIAVLSRCKTLMDNVSIVLGGPEFLGDNESFLRRNEFVDCVFRGEGETVFPIWLGCFPDKRQWSEIQGLCYIGRDGVYYDNGKAVVSDFQSLNSPYKSRFFDWDKPFVQFETTRGCFNTCAFCVSSGEKPVRELSLDQVRSRLEDIHSHGIRDVRMLDRTFNYDNRRALAMLDMFCDFHPDMRFHLEVHPALLSDQLRQKLMSLPKGMLHIEAGMQSLNQDVLEQCGRAGRLKAAVQGLRFLASVDNLVVHADLIAGLPGYSLEQVCKDVLTLAQIGVDEIQLESLKVLPGTRMRRDAGALGIRYSPLPPYEVLSTGEITPQQLRRAMFLSKMIDMYYNSHLWQRIFRRLLTGEDGTIFINSFLDYLIGNDFISSPLGQERRGIILYEYCSTAYPDYLFDISQAWIEAGMSLKKLPAERVRKVKYGSDILSETGADKLPQPEFGKYSESLRLFYLPSGQSSFTGCLYGFDSISHSPYPVYKALIHN